MLLIRCTILLAIFSLAACGHSSPAGESLGKTKQAVGGLDHLGLAVLDLEASADFFINALDFELAGGDPEYPAKFLDNGQMFLTLWQVSEPSSAARFDRRNNVGLHHLALEVSSFEQLDHLYAVVSEWPGVVIEFAPELAYGGPAKHMMINEPSGNRLELVHRPK